MNKEKVRELAKQVNDNNVNNEKIITEWLEQNQPEPVVVGLSDSQVDCLADYYFGLMRGDKQSRSTIKNAITKWLKNQTFTQIKAVPIGLSDNQIKDFGAFVYGFDVSAKKLEDMLRDWHSRQTFTQPEIKEVVVGLSDEQILSFMAKYGIHPVVGMNLKEWQKTQNFTQPNDSLIADNLKLAKELEQLKSQPPTPHPDWKDVPLWANWIAQDANGRWCWYKYKPIRDYHEWVREDDSTAVGVYISRTWRQSLQQRPQPPTPKVEVGQIWEHTRNSTSYFIASVGKVKLNDVWIESVTYRSNEYGSFTRTLDDFLAKFARAE